MFFNVSVLVWPAACECTFLFRLQHTLHRKSHELADLERYTLSAGPLPPYRKTSSALKGSEWLGRKQKETFKGADKVTSQPVKWSRESILWDVFHMMESRFMLTAKQSPLGLLSKRKLTEWFTGTLHRFLPGSLALVSLRLLSHWMQNTDVTTAVALQGLKGFYLHCHFVATLLFSTLYCKDRTCVVHRQYIDA